MNLYGFNAKRYGRWEGFLVDFDEKHYQSPFVQLLFEHADISTCVQVTYLPVWAVDVFYTWRKWCCLRATFLYVLPTFYRRQIVPDYAKEYAVSVEKLREKFDPFLLAPWLWDCPEFVPAVVSNFLNGHVTTPVGAVLHHAARIANFVRRPQAAPILLSTDFPLPGRPIAVEDGNHRFAAAIVRGDKSIKAIVVGDPSKIAPLLEG